MNEEDSSPVCSLTLSCTGQAVPRAQKVYLEVQACLPPKEILASDGAFVKGKKQERRTRSHWEAGRGNRSQGDGGRQRKTERLRKRDGCPGGGVGDRIGLASCNL